MIIATVKVREAHDAAVLMRGGAEERRQWESRLQAGRRIGLVFSFIVSEIQRQVKF
jgi:hypothetical protein